MGIENRGFASMTPRRRRALGRKGIKVVQAAGKAHKFTKEEASAAGRKGAESRAKRKAFVEKVFGKGTKVK